MTTTSAKPASNGLEMYEALFGEPSRRRGELDHASLPSPRSYLAERDLLTAQPRGNWTMIRCPAHKGGDERHPSMIVSLMDGHFRCHACGARGGDLVALHRLITGVGFREAVRDLGGRFHE